MQDNENIHRSLNAMGLVYANANLTITVADGENANHEIRGISSDSELWDVPYKVLRFPEQPLKTLKLD
jgi:hypothetical protein